jgi:serine/threonine protein phosphatase PrpC
MVVYLASVKGTRETNEDQHNVLQFYNKNDETKAKINYYAVYDGHGGDFVSNFLATNLPQYFTKSNVELPLSPTYIYNVFDNIQKQLIKNHPSKSKECGSTCNIVCVYNYKNKKIMTVINLGDSRCVICRNNIAMTLCVDHKPDWPCEYSRITKMGGQIVKDGPVYRIRDLSVSRAFGDTSAAPYVTHKPDVYKYKINEKDKFVVIACDGLWDVMSSQDVVNFVLKNCYDSSMKRINLENNIARSLAYNAIALNCNDNVTCIVVFFD